MTDSWNQSIQNGLDFTKTKRTGILRRDIYKQKTLNYYESFKY